MSKQVIIKIYGRVQGVFFRDTVRRRARKLDLVGWVKNEPDGGVMITAEGEEDSLKQLVAWCYNGPILARVDRVEVKWEEAKSEFKKFEIKY